MRLIFILSTLIVSFTTIYGQNEEEIAIKILLEKEGATWRSGDVKGHAECWAAKPYSRILISGKDGTAMDVPISVMINPAPNIMGKGGTFLITNLKMNVVGNNAWVSHDEVSTSEGGNITNTFEMRILEKESGKWKIVGQSIHVLSSKSK